MEYLYIGNDTHKMISYLIFVISFAQAGFSKTKFYTQKKRLKAPKKLKMSLKKSNICIFFHSLWKNLHLTENFYTDMSVVSVTNMRYAYQYCPILTQ